MTGNDEKKVEEGDGTGKIIISPYYLSANDNPGTITQVQLKGENYDEWAKAIRTALRAKKKFGFIDGTVKQPSEDSTELEDWWTINSMLVSWILNTIEPKLRSTISYVEIAQNFWEAIKEHFSVSNGPRIHELKTELVECTQKGVMIVDYYGRLKSIWEILSRFQHVDVVDALVT